MSTQWKKCVCCNPSTVQLDAGNFLTESSGSQGSAIDDFYSSRTAIIKEGNREVLGRAPFLGPLLLVGLISATEYFLRRVISECIDLCETSKKSASSANLKLGSALWHGGGGVSKGAMEHISLADVNSVRKQIRDFLGHDIKPNSDSWAALMEFGKICELRHGIVHSNGWLPGINAVNLGFPISGLGEAPPIKVGVSELQESAEVCSALVASINNELFELIAGRWASAWSHKHDAKKFNKLWVIFHSEFDEKNGLIENSLTRVRCRNLLKRERP
ncbi:hypothetical protein [Roseibacillus persicicus]|uniref:hypothetical protein n=1 Tax=Roseibacillus persicicus TaxID=454148 RepID=UPI00280CD60D|nr:hypothetical protein [Roseibacillus persicicus]MDQ8189253.1 hypothetical protein [Roseibacillus persicicus]